VDKITIELDAKWKRLANSRLYFVVSALQGVAVTFAPLFLYWSGRSRLPLLSDHQWWFVPLCFAMIFLVPLFYYRLGNAVIKELRRQ